MSDGAEFAARAWTPSVRVALVSDSLVHRIFLSRLVELAALRDDHIAEGKIQRRWIRASVYPVVAAPNLSDSAR
jgi:hypothetical protein